MKHQMMVVQARVKQKRIVLCYTLELSEEINFSGPVWQQSIPGVNAYLQKSLCETLIHTEKQQLNCIIES